MKLLFLSDIHGNHLALESALKYAEKLHVDQIYCCGDICGYFTNINEVVALLNKYNVISILGNHDAYFLGTLPLCKNRSYYQSHVLSRDQIDEFSLNYIADLPKTLKLEIEGLKIDFIHGGFNDLLNESVFPDKLNISDYKADVTVFGHTHLQFGFREGCQVFLNPGSIGLPRNGDFRAHFMTFDTQTLAIEEFRTTYDVNLMINESLQSTSAKFIHNLNFGRSYSKILNKSIINSLIFVAIEKYNRAISIIKTKFGLILAFDAFQSSNNLLYMAFYEDGSIELTSSTLVYNWQLKKETVSCSERLDECLVRYDSAGLHYYTIYRNVENLLDNINNELDLAFEMLTKFKLNNVKI